MEDSIDTSRMKITFFTKNSLRFYGGGEKWLIDIGNALVEKNYDVYVISAGVLPKERINFEHLKKLIKFKYFEIDIPKIKFRSFEEYFVRFFSDIVYIINLWDSTFLSFLLKRKEQKLIIGNHGLFFTTKGAQIKNLLFKYLAKLFFNKVKNVKIHVLNSEQYKFYRILGFKEIYLIPNFVNVKEYYIPQDTEDFIVLFIGRFNVQKGVDILLQIIEKVLEKCANIKFWICGSGDPYYENLIKKLEERYPENVKYFGFVPEEMKKEFLSKASLFLVPSRVEGQPIAVLEALVSGCPFLGSNIITFKDLIKFYNRNFGWVVKQYTPITFAESIIRIYQEWKENPDEYFERRKYIAKKARVLFNMERVIGMFENLLIL